MLYIVLFILLVVYTIIILNRIHHTKILEIKKVYDMCKTGDIICFRSCNTSILYDIFSPFTHIGMILEKNGKKYILEIDDNDNIGVEFNDLLSRIKTYKGTLFLCQLEKIASPKNIEFFHSKLPTLIKDMKYNKDYRKHLMSNCFKKLFFSFDNEITNFKHMFCSEFVAYMLQELKILDTNHDITCTLPGDFRRLKDSKTSGYLYKNIIKVC
jgi:hypothetical protein